MERARITPIDPNRLERQSFDLIIIGAGVNGAGIARDAAMRGLRVLLLDKGDISSGTTSWSTRLIHGGLRYLEYYEVPLVRESLHERQYLLQIAPHLVTPLKLIIPIYETNRRGPGLIRLGMIAYDVLSYDKSLEHHTMMNSAETLRRVPGLNADGLLGAAAYYDAQVTFPERLTMENALSAHDHGAAVVTYLRADELIREGGTITGVRVTDLFSGQRFSVRAPITVNVAGPWVDQVLDGVSSHRMIGGTKGSHIIVDPFPGAPRDALYVEAKDGRPYFIVPWNDLYLIGTTDLRYQDDLDEVVPSEEEIDYLLDETDRVIPQANLTRADVRYAYAGVRPLPFTPEGAEGGITRRHIIHDHAPEYQGLISITGGKLTTYRNLAGQTVDLIFKKLGRPRVRCHTAKIPLPGGNTDDWERFSADFRARAGLDSQTANRLLTVYGVFAQQIVEIAQQYPELAKPFSDIPGTLGAEVIYALRWERAETLGDILLRRTMLGLDRHAGLDAVERAAAIAERHGGWDRERATNEISDYRRYVERFKPRSLNAREPISETVDTRD